MQSPTIQMEQDQAARKLEEYEAAAKANPKAFREIDKGLIDGWRALAKGKRLVDVNEAIRHGGLNLAGIPKLAIARAHVERTTWKREANWRYTEEQPRGSWWPTGGGTYSWIERTRLTDDRAQWVIAAETFDGLKARDDWRGYIAFCPLIPLPLRPKQKLDNYFLLWEANWHPAPPVDPYLLRPIAGAVMEIIAEWELSALEIAAVRGAMQQQS